MPPVCWRASSLSYIRWDRCTFNLSTFGEAAAKRPHVDRSWRLCNIVFIRLDAYGFGIRYLTYTCTSTVHGGRARDWM